MVRTIKPLPRRNFNKRERMRATPFLELKLNTTPLPFLLEVFRLCGLHMTASQPPQKVVRVEVRLPGQPFSTRDRNIRVLSRQELEKFTGNDSSEWTLLFHTPIDDEATWKSLFEFELLDVGGDLPLLVSLVGYSDGLDSFATTFVTRCLTLWDAKLVHFVQMLRVLWRAFWRPQDWQALTTIQGLSSLPKPHSANLKNQIVDQSGLRHGMEH